MKGRIIEDMSLFLLKEGYILKGLNSTFDILARKGDKTLLVKVVQDANSLNASQIGQMKSIASYISGSPLIIAETASYALEGNVVYSRYGVVTVTLSTFKECVRKSSPFIRASKAGLTASVDGIRLRGAREKEGYSMNSLAKRIGVSNRMIAKYENEDAEINVNHALRIYNLFGEDVFNRIDIFSRPSMDCIEVSSDVSMKYASLGFNVFEAARKPFEIISRKDNEVILTSVGDIVNKDTMSLARIINAENLLVFKSKKPKTESPSISKEDFLEFEEANEIIKFLKEF